MGMNLKYMNCPESVRTIEKSNFCDHCIRNRNSNQSKNIFSQGYRVTQNKRNNNYYENYAVPDDYCCSKENFNNPKPYNQNACLDEYAEKALASLRQRANQVVQDSYETECSKEYGTESDSNPNHCCSIGGPAKYVENLNYSPQSKFLRRMKRQNEGIKDNEKIDQTQCECENCGPTGDYYQAQIFCPCSMCCPNDCDSQNAYCRRDQIRESQTPFSDMSSIHDPCTCFRTWRTNGYSGDLPRYQYEILRNEGDICGDQAHTRNFLREDECEFEYRGRRKKKDKSGHVSRLDKRKKRTSRRRNKPSPRPSESPGIDFSPSLKRPHPNSCERCWRYASPSRSPVNKPDQRYDPNYRRSHSQINIYGTRKGASSGANTDSRIDYNFETEVPDFFHSEPKATTKVKSSDDIHKMTTGRTKRPSIAAEKSEVKPKDIGGKIGREESDYPSPKNKTFQKTGVSFSERRIMERYQKPGPIQCSPSIFDKNSKKSDISNRPRTFGLGPEKLEYITDKRRPTSAYQVKARCENAPGARREKEKTEGSKQRPATAFQTRTPRESNETRHSFDGIFGRRNDKGENTNRSRAKNCTCTKSKPQPENEKERLKSDQPCFREMEKNDFSGSRAMLLDNPHYFVRRSDKIYPGQHYENERRSFQGFDNSKLCKCCKREHDCSRSRFVGEGSNRGQSPRKMPITNKKTGLMKDENNFRSRSKYRSEYMDQETNPRKYCVFYANESKQNKVCDDDDDDGVEVLIEEFTECRGHDSKSDNLKEKMKKMKEQRLDSMALRFQKGVAEKFKKRESNRYLYF